MTVKRNSECSLVPFQIYAVPPQKIAPPKLGAFASVAGLQEAIGDCLDEHNSDPKPFVLTKSADTYSKRSAPPSSS